ncbi:MAG: DUF2079 domain-containing protein, partial [Ktedonobacteraceae bacterium]|nr:DUF2079 domain-containing protein [Ktedonobacteraceae bacterium]
WIVQWVLICLESRPDTVSSEGTTAPQSATSWPPSRVFHIALLCGMLCLVLFTTVRRDETFFGKMLFAENFQWPTISAHTSLAQRFIAMIPLDASVSAQTKLVPHLSHRANIYMFPYGTPFNPTQPATVSTDKADYILLDLEGDYYPYNTSLEYIHDVKTVLLSGDYGVLAAQDGYLLLKRGLPQPGISPDSVVSAAQLTDPALNYLVLPNLPASLCSDIYVAPQNGTQSAQATFASSDGGSLSLLNFNVKTSDTINRTSGITVTTEWRVNTPIKVPMQMLFLMTDSAGKEYFVSNDVSQLYWCQTNTWKTGAVIRLTSRTFTINDSKVPYGLAHLSLALLPLAQTSDKMMDIQARLLLHVENVASPTTPTQNTNALQLKSINIIP